jgi:hypothetical protein
MTLIKLNGNKLSDINPAVGSFRQLYQQLGQCGDVGQAAAVRDEVEEQPRELQERGDSEAAGDRQGELHHGTQWHSDIS